MDPAPTKPTPADPGPAAPSLAARLDALFEGVHPGWPPFFEKHGLLDLARQGLTRAEPDAAQLAPPPGLVFEAFRYFNPADAKVVIMGQDPFPRPGCAQGLCFSIPPGNPLEPSLVSIVENLERHGLARVHHAAKDDAQSRRLRCGDLRPWAAQGALLLNASLTTRVGVRDAHSSYWSGFTRGLVRALSAEAAAAGRPLVFMLWGNSARAYAPDVQGGHPVYHWTHPSPLSNNRLPEASRFENAPHFADANSALRAAGLRPIQWDPLGFTYAFTDGSCLRNGADDAEAAFAVFILTGPLKGAEVRGRVAPRVYVLADPSDPARGFALGSEAATPTNNRGEYLAWCWLLLLLLRGCVRGRVEVVSDCNLFIQTMEDWLPKRRRKGQAESLKNYDLVVIGEALLAAVRAATAGVALTHIHSHQKPPPPGTGPEAARARVFWYGNDRVDRAAGGLLADEGAEDFEFRCPPDADDAMRWRLVG